MAKLVKVYDLHDEFTAVSLKDLLEQNGIPSMVRKNEVPGFGFAFDHRTWAELLVNEQDAEKALELIAGFMGSLGELAEADDSE